VLFVNGNSAGRESSGKRPGLEGAPFEQAISQNIRKSGGGLQSRGFSFLAQTAVGGDEETSRPTETTGTGAKFWSPVWRELHDVTREVSALVNRPLPKGAEGQAIPRIRFGYVRHYFDELESGRAGQVTEQEQGPMVQSLFARSGWWNWRFRFGRGPTPV